MANKSVKCDSIDSSDLSVKNLLCSEQMDFHCDCDYNDITLRPCVASFSREMFHTLLEYTE